jgi:hypothetical protein
MGKIIIITILIITSITGISFSPIHASDNKYLKYSRAETAEVYSFDIMPDVLQGTDQLTMESDLSVQMLDRAHSFIEKIIAASIEYFNGGNSGRCEGTFTFLHKHLNWP